MRIVGTAPLDANEAHPNTSETYFVRGVHAEQLVERACEDIPQQIDDIENQ